MSGPVPASAAAVAAALVALALGDRGLLLPAGSDAGSIRVGAVVVAVAALVVLVRLDGPARGARTLALVATVGVLVAAATLPRSPVTTSESGVLDALPDPVPAPDDAPGTVVLDQVGPETVPSAGVLTLPPGAEVVLDGDTVVVRLPDGSTSRLGRATAGPAGAPDAAPAPGAAPGVVIVDGGVSRTDGGPIGGDTPLGGLTLDGGGGVRVVVGEGVLLDVPTPEPAPLEEPFDRGPGRVLALVLLALAVTAVTPPLARLGRWLHPVAVTPAPIPEPPTGPRIGDVEEGLAEVLRAMLVDPDPRTAVIGAYARLLTALAEAGAPRRAEEGPHEHLWRSLGPLGVRRAPLHRLAELFVLARFTPRPVTEAHRQAAIAALADAVADLRLSARDVEAAARETGVAVATVGVS